jgi:SAM-dependent methyltransferase
MSYLNRVIGALQAKPVDKYKEEADFWTQTVADLIAWYEGKGEPMYGHQSPTEGQKVKVQSLKDSAILTWFEIHQKPKYLADLDLKADAFKGMKVLDIGSGPMPSGLCFNDVELYNLDPLFHLYLASGFPIHYYDNTRFVHAYSETIPLEDSSIDAVISVNAIDHVDDIQKTAQEIKRVLKKDGKLAMHVHYHKATATEPLELNDEVFSEAFRWCKGLKRISESTTKFGFTITIPDEKYVVWRNC